MSTDPNGPVIARRLDPDVAHNVQRVLGAAAAADGFTGLSDQLRADVDDLGDGAAADAFVAVASAGFAVASRRDHEWTLQVVVDPPSRSELATAQLVDAALAEVAGSGGGRVDWWVYAPSDGDDSVAAMHGLSLDRELLQMRRDLPAEWRAEIGTRGLHPGVDEEAWLAVNNRAFAGHHEQSGWTLDTLRQRMRQPWFDPDGVRLHERDGRLAGFCWTKVHTEGDGERTGEIYVIGVDPDFQGLGLGKQLTLAGLDHLAGKGITRAMLYVAAENTTALAMYERLGFTVHRVDRAYVGQVVATAL